MTLGRLFNLSKEISGRIRTGGSCPLGSAADCKEPFLRRYDLNIRVPERVISNCKLTPASAQEMKSKRIIGVGLSSPRKEVKSRDLGGTKETYLSAELGTGVVS